MKIGLCVTCNAGLNCNRRVTLTSYHAGGMTGKHARYERVVFVLFSKIQLMFVPSRAAQWYHPVPIMSQTRPSDARSLPDSKRV